MKRFGGFLLDTGLISTAQLAEALMIQIENTPPSVSVLYKNGEIDAEQVLKILTLQSQENIDFPSACSKLNIWRSDFSNVLRRRVAQTRPKLGKILIDKGWVEPQKLLAELHRFNSFCNEQQFASQLETPILSANNGSDEPSKKSSTEVSDAELPEIKFEPIFTHVEIESVPDYLDIFSEEKKNSMEITILSLENIAGSDEMYNTLDAFFGEYHSLKGAARSVGAALTEELIHQAEDLLVFFKQFSSQVSGDDFVDLTAINLKVLDLLWDLRNALMDNATEELYWNEKNSRVQYLDLLKNIHKRLRQLDNRGYELCLADLDDQF